MVRQYWNSRHPWFHGFCSGACGGRTPSATSPPPAGTGSLAADSIRFGKESEKDVVNLGDRDGAGDLVDIKSLKKIKRLTINQFGAEDSLGIGGKTYTCDQLKDISLKNISVSFD